MAIFLKDPGAMVDYAVEWSADYLAGATITASAWAVTPAGGITVAASAIAPGRTTVTLAGGRVGTLYHITNRVDFSNGRRDARLLALRVEDRG